MRNIQELLEEVKVEYANKPMFQDLIRVYRIAKRIPNKEKEKKIGYFIKEAEKVSGSMKNKEKIIRDIFGKKQVLKGTEFIEKILEYEIEPGVSIMLKHETGYQTTNRLLANQKINKTIAASIFGDILDDIIKGMNEQEKNAFSKVMSVVGGHFENATAFLRWSNLTEKWIHIDAVQTDFFNKLRRELHEKDVPRLAKEVMNKEEEFYKTALSYVVRQYPKVKIFTMNTPELISAVENVRGTGKKLQLYHNLPKNLGFKLIPISRLEKILETRPGSQELRVFKNFSSKVSDALGRGSESGKTSLPSAELRRIGSNINKYFSSRIAKSQKITSLQVDNYFNNNVKKQIGPNYQNSVRKVLLSFHQFIDEITEAVNKEERTKLDQVIRKMLAETRKALDAGQATDDTIKIWWSNRGMIFEDTSILNFVKDVIYEKTSQ